MNNIITTKQASKLLHLEPRWTRELIRSGRLAGYRQGRDIFTTREAVAAYLRGVPGGRMRKKGRRKSE